MTMPNFCINFLNKAAKLLSISYDFAVAPSSDAWIKTLEKLNSSFDVFVAPSSDAWIKTLLACRVNFNHLSHPPRMRGLKRNSSHRI